MSIGKFVVAAALAASAVVVTPVFAADLSYQDQGYQERRYGDVYRQPPPPAYRQPQRYGYESRRDGCVPREQVRDDLEARGWQDFHDPQPMGNVVHIRARRPSGRLFDLTLDRCTGEVLQAEAIDHRAAAAPLPPPPQDWRYGRPTFERPYQRY